jgi:hypothetical protein
MQQALPAKLVSTMKLKVRGPRFNPLLVVFFFLARCLNFAWCCACVGLLRDFTLWFSNGALAFVQRQARRRGLRFSSGLSDERWRIRGNFVQNAVKACKTTQLELWRTESSFKMTWILSMEGVYLQLPWCWPKKAKTVAELKMEK